MEIRRSSDADACTGSEQRSMTVAELRARFPEVPQDLEEESVLLEYVAALGPLLRIAAKPTPCMRDGGDHPHVLYRRLVNDLAIYGVGLARRDRTLARLRATLEEYRGRPATFACMLLPRRPRGTPRAGCG